MYNAPSQGATDAISPAFQRTKHLLFNPFRFSFWWRMTLVCLYSGQLAGSFNGFNFNLPSDWPQSRRRGGSSGFLADFPWHNVDPSTVWVWVGIAVIGLVALAVFVLVFMYISSMLQFVLFDSVLIGECHIRQNWSRRQRAGRKYFKFSLIVSAVVWTIMLMVFGTPILFAWASGLFAEPSRHLWVLIGGGIVVALLFLVFALAAAAFGVLARDLLVPVLAMEDIPLGEAFDKAKMMVVADKGGYAIYALMRFLLAIAVGIVFGIINVILFLLVLVPTAVVGVLIFSLVPAGSGAPHFALIGIFVLIGIAILIALIVATLFISLPGAIFQQSFSMYFVAARYAPLTPYMYPPPLIPPAPPPMAPPAEPAPA
jgi:hypothetical protein